MVKKDYIEPNIEIMIIQNDILTASDPQIEYPFDRFEMGE